MQNNEEIELSSIQATAYWWINLIRSKVKEILIEESSDKNNTKFAKIFCDFTEVDWRNLYLQLVDCITEDVNNYVPKGNVYGIDSFSQDTDKGGHNRINNAISKILQKSIPDIRLASNSSKDWVIYTNMFGASVLYKSCGVSDLSTKYEPSYVLTGDENELDFYNQVISTIAVLQQKNCNFHSLPLLRSGFCDEYKRLYPSDETLDEIKDHFNKTFDKASDRDIIFGRSYKESYFANFRDFDYVGLENYMELAEHYARIILQIKKAPEGQSLVKKIRRNKDDKKH